MVQEEHILKGEQVELWSVEKDDEKILRALINQNYETSYAPFSTPIKYSENIFDSYLNKSLTFEIKLNMDIEGYILAQQSQTSQHTYKFYCVMNHPEHILDYGNDAIETLLAYIENKQQHIKKCLFYVPETHEDLEQAVTLADCVQEGNLSNYYYENGEYVDVNIYSYNMF